MSGVTRGALSSRAALLALAAALAMPARAAAQIPGVVRPPGPERRLELRLDAFAAEVDALHIGGGVAIPAGTYVRIAALAGAGVARVPQAGEDETGASARAEVVARFHFDPTRQSRWGPYAGGGVAVRSDVEDCCRGVLTLVFGLEGPARQGRTFAFEVGLGGGVRAGIALRTGGGRWR